MYTYLELMGLETNFERWGGTLPCNSSYQVRNWDIGLILTVSPYTYKGNGWI